VSEKLHAPCQKDRNLPDQNKINPPVQLPASAINVPWIILVVIGFLIAVHLGLQLAGQSWQISAQFAFAFIPIRFTQPYFPQIRGSAYWSMLTYGLLHADWLHLGFNSLWLLIFSKPVVLRLGSLRYLALLLLSIFAGAVAGLIVHWGEFVVMVGISAGVSGVMAAAIPLMYARGARWELNSAEHMAMISPLTPVQILRNRTAFGFTIMWLALTMFTATSQYFTGTAFLEERVIAWEAHLGGFIAGFILFYLLDRKQNSQ
jgi:membrane associated rhomboid family serine protease